MKEDAASQEDEADDEEDEDMLDREL